MKILLTGGNGFIGTRLVGDLAGHEHNLTIFDVQPSRAHSALWSQGDVRDARGLAGAVQGVDAIFHLAAEHRDDVQPISLYTDVNVGGARNLVTALDSTGCRRVVFTSSVAVYPLNLQKPGEGTEPRPFNPYGQSKLEAERVLVEWARRTPNASLTIVRPCVVFGPSNRGNVYNLLSQICRGRFLMVGSGRNKKSMAYVDNLNAFLASRLGAPPGIHLFNYADKPDLSVADLVAIANRALHRQPKLRDRVHLPYFAGLLAGYGFDAVARVTGRKLPLSSIRIHKFCAETTIATKRLEATGFQRPYSLQQALEQWIQQEFASYVPSLHH